MTFLTKLGVTEILCSLRLVIKGKAGNEIPESWILEFLEKFLGSNFALSNTVGNSSGSLNRGDVADLPFMITQLAIR